MQTRLICTCNTLQDRGYWDEDNEKLFPKTAKIFQDMDGALMSASVVRQLGNPPFCLPLVCTAPNALPLKLSAQCTDPTMHEFTPPAPQPPRWRSSLHGSPLARV